MLGSLLSICLVHSWDIGILWGSFLLMKTFRYDVMIWHCSYIWWSMNMNWSWCLSFSLLGGGSMKTNKVTYRMIMIYKQRGVPTIYWSAIVQYRYIKILQTARFPHYLRMSCKLFLNVFYKHDASPLFTGLYFALFIFLYQYPVKKTISGIWQSNIWKN